jgi:hypothetical protein
MERREFLLAGSAGMGFLAGCSAGSTPSEEGTRSSITDVETTSADGTPTDPGAPLDIDATILQDAIAPGSELEVEVTVTNEGDTWLPDLRLIDGVPAMLTVVDGTARHATALRPGETATLEYAVADGAEFDVQVDGVETAKLTVEQ